MSLHLVHPCLTTTGKKKGKSKFRNAEEAKRHRELAESWNKMQEKWKAESPLANKAKSTKQPLKYNNMPEDQSRSTKHIPSLNTGLAVATKSTPKIYTGTALLGIGQLHKSNAVPVFSSDDAVAIAKMRR